MQPPPVHLGRPPLAVHTVQPVERSLQRRQKRRRRGSAGRAANLGIEWRAREQGGGAGAQRNMFPMVEAGVSGGAGGAPRPGDGLRPALAPRPWEPL